MSFRDDENFNITTVFGVLSFFIVVVLLWVFTNSAFIVFLYMSLNSSLLGDEEEEDIADRFDVENVIETVKLFTKDYAAVLKSPEFFEFYATVDAFSDEIISTDAGEYSGSELNLLDMNEFMSLVTDEMLIKKNINVQNFYFWMLNNIKFLQINRLICKNLILNVEFFFYDFDNSFINKINIDISDIEKYRTFDFTKA